MSQNLNPDQITALKLIFILIKICEETDEEKLKKFTKYCGMYIPDKQFSKILRKTLAKIKTKACRGYACEDWLMVNLYKIYSEQSEIFSQMFKEY